MIPCFNHDGMKSLIGWFVAERIIRQFDTGHAKYVARMAADPTYKPNAFGDKPRAAPRKTNEEAMADYCAKVRAGTVKEDWRKR